MAETNIAQIGAVVTRAHELAASGLPVFPCRENKSPATPHGFHDATSMPKGVDDLWRRFPGPLIGVRTGLAAGFDVLDLDPRHGAGQWLDANAKRLPETRIYQTRSGGWHMLFRHRDGVRNSAGKIGPGVDVRGEGGFVVWWNAAGFASVSDADIADWPQWLFAAQTYVPPPPRAYTAAKTLQARTEAIERIVGNALYRLRTAPSGRMHLERRAAAYTVGGVLAVGQISESEAFDALMDAARASGTTDIVAAEKTIRWGLSKGQETPLVFGGVK